MAYAPRMQADSRLHNLQLPADTVGRALRAVAIWKAVAIACVPLGLAGWVWIGLLTPGSVLALVGGIIAAVIAAQMWVRSRRRLDVALGDWFQRLVEDEPLRLGECFDSCRVVVNDDDMVYLVSGLVAARGLIRMCAAILSIVFGVHLLTTMLSVGLMGTKPLLLAVLVIAVVPAFLSFPFTVSWGVSRTANEGAPGLLLQRVWFFFVARVETIGKDQIARIEIERVAFKGGEYVQLFIEESTGRKRSLAVAGPGTVAERRLAVLRSELRRVIG